LAILKYVGLPPAPMNNVGKSGLNFLFSVIHTTLNCLLTVGFVLLMVNQPRKVRYSLKCCD
jgi:hypothetical protein